MIERKAQSVKRKVSRSSILIQRRDPASIIITIAGKVKSLKFLALSFSFTFFALNFTLLCGCQNKTLHKDSQVMMGTYVEVNSPDKNAANIVFTEIKRIEDLLSKYNPDSEVAKLNQSGQLKVSPDTLYVLQKAKEFWQLSDGAFDITVGPLMDVWGFTDKKYNFPKEKEIKKTLKIVGFDKIIFNADDNMVKFKTPGMKIDLGGIAKGYALDCAVKKLKENRIKSCLINAGGQIYASGDKFGQPWTVAVRSPRKTMRLEDLKLKDESVATSGDYEQYFMHKNKRYSHIFNPKTGYPADSGVVSVTVISSDALTADALATSIFVLGKEKGLELAGRIPGVRVSVIQEKDVVGQE